MKKLIITLSLFLRKIESKKILTYLLFIFILFILPLTFIYLDVSNKSYYLESILKKIVVYYITFAQPIILLFIIGRHWKADQDKLHLDLFNKRFEIYKGVIEFRDFTYRLHSARLEKIQHLEKQDEVFINNSDSPLVNLNFKDVEKNYSNFYFKYFQRIVLVSKYLFGEDLEIYNFLSNEYEKIVKLNYFLDDSKNEERLTLETLRFNLSDKLYNYGASGNIQIRLEETDLTQSKDEKIINYIHNLLSVKEHIYKDLDYLHTNFLIKLNKNFEKYLYVDIKGKKPPCHFMPTIT